MSKEILFKAKRIDNGEWVEGFYFCMVHDDGRHIHHFIMPLGADLNYGTPIEKIQVEIEINTLCQYTGLADKNGNKIWENDIVRDVEDDITMLVRWDDEELRYVLDYYSLNGDIMDTFGFNDFCSPINRSLEIIGNVFDNPELIGR